MVPGAVSSRPTSASRARAVSVLRRTRAALAGVITPSRAGTGHVRRHARPPHPAGVADRAAWVDVAQRLAEPVLANLAAGTLRARMPVEQAAGEDRTGTTYLEAVGRLLSGIAPWLELEPDDTDEGRLRARYRQLTLDAIGVGLDPDSPDALELPQGLPRRGRCRLPGPRRAACATPVRDPRCHDPATARRVARGDPAGSDPTTTTGCCSRRSWRPRSPTSASGGTRCASTTRSGQHAQWYVGDGIYGDGPEFHWDYYDSFVIHPMLTEILDVVGLPDQVRNRAAGPATGTRAPIRRQSRSDSSDPTAASRPSAGRSPIALAPSMPSPRRRSGARCRKALDRPRSGAP